MQIVVGPTSIENLFTGRTKVVVPNFQRNYAWTPTQITEFMDDIIDSAGDDHSHFWGPVVFLRSESDPDVYEVIDGQQRLTSAIIMLSLLRDEAFAFSGRLIYAGTPGEHNLYTKFRNILFLPPHYQFPRFTANYLVEKAFNTSVLPDPKDASGTSRPHLSPGGRGMSNSEKKNTKELRKAYTNLKKRLQDELSKYGTDAEKKEFLDSIFRALTSSFEIHSMVLGDVNDAYVLFETLNNRGLRLNPADLLKTLTLRQIRETSSQKKFDDALELWDDTTEVLGDYDFSKFLRHYLLTQTQEKIQVNKIYRTFSTTIAALGKNGAEQNLVKLNKASLIYAQLLNIEENDDPILQRCFARMDTYSDTHRVFLLGMMLLKLDKASQQRLARAIEVISFRWIAAGQNAQELETFYQTTIHRLAKDTSIKGVDAIVDLILDHAPSDAVLSSLQHKESTTIQKYALRRIEDVLAKSPLDWDNKAAIQHFAPLKPLDPEYWGHLVAPMDTVDGEPDYEDFADSWGNLGLIERSLLNAVERENWPVKVSGLGDGKHDGLSKSKFKLTQAACTQQKWTRALIEHRSEWLRDSILQLCGKDWAKDGKESIKSWSPPKQ